MKIVRLDYKNKKAYVISSGLSKKQAERICREFRDDNNNSDIDHFVKIGDCIKRSEKIGGIYIRKEFDCYDEYDVKLKRCY